MRTQFDSRSLVLPALQLYGLQGLNFLIPLMSVSYLLRILGPQSYGSIAFAQALIAYAVVVTDYGFNLTAARDISVDRDDADAVARIFWTTLLTKLLLFLSCTTVLGLIVMWVPLLRPDRLIFAACWLVLAGNVAFPSWYLQGIERQRQAALVLLVSRCTITAGIFAFVRSPADLLLAALLISAPLVLSGLVAIVFQRRSYPRKFYRPTWLDVRDCLAGGWYMFAASVSTTLYLQTNAFVLGIMADKRAVAYFSVGYTIVLAVQGLSIPATQAIYPRVSLLFSRNPAQAWDLLRNLGLILLPVMAAVSVLMAVFAAQLIQLTAGTQYSNSVTLVRIMAMLPFMISLAALLGPCIMVNVNLSRQLMWIYLLVGIVNVLLLPLLIRGYAAAGAAAALVIAESFGPIAMIGALWTNRSRLPGSTFQAER